MSAHTDTIDEFVASDYKYGFVTDIESESLEPGLNEDVVRFISAKKNEPEWLLEWRLKALRHFEKMESPTWPHVKYPPVDFQDISYYSAPKKKGDGPKSLDEVDPKLLETYEKLGVPLHERARLAGVAVDAVFDSESIGTFHFRENRWRTAVKNPCVKKNPPIQNTLGSPVRSHFSMAPSRRFMSSIQFDSVFRVL